MTGSPGGTFATTNTIALDAPARHVVAAHLDHDPAFRTDLVVSSDAGRVMVIRGEPGSAPCTSGCTPTVAGSTQAASASAAPGASGGLTVARPSLLRDGDVLYAFLTKSDDVGTLSAPAGWTQIGQWATTADDDFTSGVWRKALTSAGSEPASYPPAIALPKRTTRPRRCPAMSWRSGGRTPPRRRRRWRMPPGPTTRPPTRRP